jgi:hypothetical protein
MTPPKSPERRRSRTRIVTALSIVAVGLASLFAIGANLGILTSAGQSTVGNVSAAGDLIPSDTRVVDVYPDQQGTPLTSTTVASTGSQRFTIDTAGTVDVSVDATGARLDLVSPASGWTAVPVTTTSADVAVVFTDGTRTLQFTAAAGADGTVTGDVTEASGTVTARQPTDQQRSPGDHGYEGADDDD